jgi:phage-related protein
MPTCRLIRDGLWEVRCALPSNRIARVLFFTTDEYLVLVHGFIKKTQTTPKQDIDLAFKRIQQTK